MQSVIIAAFHSLNLKEVHLPTFNTPFSSISQICLNLLGTIALLYNPASGAGSLPLRALTFHKSWENYCAKIDTNTVGATNRSTFERSLMILPYAYYRSVFAGKNSQYLASGSTLKTPPGNGEITWVAFTPKSFELQALICHQYSLLYTESFIINFSLCVKTHHVSSVQKKLR